MAGRANIWISDQSRADIEALAKRWGLYTPADGKPNVSATIAKALREAAERE